MDIRAVIMAGGIGTRFWPLSRRQKPKQFLPIISEKTMIEETVERLLPLIPSKDIFTIANRERSKALAQLIPSIPESNLLVEPEGRNTAPSLMLATAAVYLQNPEAVIAALPADHLIVDTSRFLQKLAAGGAAAASEEVLMTFGIPPTYPATGYGYIHFKADAPQSHSGEDFFPVVRFKEKPQYELACDFIKQGTFFWNSGIFLWRASVFADKLKTCSPQFFVHWTALLNAFKSGDAGRLGEVFRQIPATSIDYALMEKASGVLMGRGDFGWSDVGSWSALADIWDRNEQNNTFRGKVLALDSTDCLAYSPRRLTALVGVKDLLVIDTEDALLICHSTADQKVKDVVDVLKKEGQDDLL
ncbi:MAG: NTP transferase domain-containing protein [Acidobacteria bacterium]|nr:NTP transferase domain-containing protein [Acidobacteriota bacterium]